MAQQTFKVPPKLGDDYERWKNELKMWKLVTDLDKKKQALAVALSLTGKAREAALEISAETLNTDDGMSQLIQQLDKMFKKDAVDSAYEAYKNFDNFHRSSEMKMTEYILEFEQRYTKMKKYEMELPSAILAFKLLDSSDLPTRDRQLALTACTEVKFDVMKSALKRIFSEDHHGNVSGATSESVIKVEPESVLATEKFQRRGEFSEKQSLFQKGTNPLNKFGKRSRCAVCGSVFHWVKDCPDRKTNKPDEKMIKSESVNITLLTEKRTANEVFVIESYGCAVIDTACTKTVCGRNWLDHYIQSLNDKQRKSVSSKESHQEFRFGDGESVYSDSVVAIPAHIGKTDCSILTEVVDCHIPLLLSKESLKKADTVLDIRADKVQMFGENVELNLTSSGHYCVDLLNTYSIQNANDSLVSEVLAAQTIEEMCSKNTLVKLHKQFGHASAERLSALLKDSGVNQKEVFSLLSDIVKNCNVCVRFKHPASKPAVSVPLSKKFNHMIAVDLHELSHSVWYMHIIDLFTRYSAACVIRNKQSSTIVKNIMQIWIAVHGAPKYILSDNGREFDSNVFRDFCENFNIIVKTTAAESPWSNGVLERHNRTINEILNKVKYDNNLDWETSLAWAISAKNSLASNSGFSPNQLVYGENMNLPSVLQDDLPAMEGTTIDKYVADHLTALHATRKAFIESESSERIRRALRKQTRNYDESFNTGDTVFYKRGDSDEWKGPGTVIGKDGVVTFVRHGGTYVHVHKCRLTKTNDEFCEKMSDSVENPENASQEVSREIENETDDYDELNNDVCVDVNNSGSFDNDSVPVGNVSDTSSCAPQQVKTRPGSFMKFINPSDGSENVVKILSRAGKATGRNQNWYNVEYYSPDFMKGEKQSIDLKTVDNLCLCDNTDPGGITSVDSEETVMFTSDISFNDAKMEELKKWLDYNVYEEVQDEGQKCVSTRWILTVKETQSGNKAKARLVARGFEDGEKDEIAKDSPTCSKEALRMLFAIIISKKIWRLKSMDIRAAFLQGSVMTRNIFLKPPKEARKPGIIWHLRKCVYGLGDASLYWYMKVKDVMLSCGGLISKMDPAVFYWRNKACDLIGVLACHVDDFIHAGDESFDKVICELRVKLNVGCEEVDCFKYIGLNIDTQSNLLTVDQNDYVKSLHPVTISKLRSADKDSKLNTQETEVLQSKIGQIMWIANQTRPDIMFEACSVSSKIKRATVKDILHINKIIKTIKSDSVQIKFQTLGNPDSLKLVIFSDASLGTLADGGSQGGHIIFLVGWNGHFSLIAWKSKRIRRVVRSTLAAEALAMSDAIDSGVFLSELYSELVFQHSKKLPIECITDNKSLYEAVHSNNPVEDKRLRIEISSMKELIASKTIVSFKWVKSENQLADCLTKKGSSSLALLRVLETGLLDM